MSSIFPTRRSTGDMHLLSTRINGYAPASVTPISPIIFNCSPKGSIPGSSVIPSASSNDASVRESMQMHFSISPNVLKPASVGSGKTVKITASAAAMAITDTELVKIIRPGSPAVKAPVISPKGIAIIPRTTPFETGLRSSSRHILKATGIVKITVEPIMALRSTPERICT